MIRSLLAACLLMVFSLSPALAAGWSKLMTPGDLKAQMETPGLVVLDVRAPAEFAAGHIPGAVNAPYGLWRGPRENPGQLIEDAQVTAVLQSAGITPESPVVVTYDGKGTTAFGAAARVYWTLKSAGLSQIAVLNGGNTAWVGAGEALSTEARVPVPSQTRFQLADDWAIDRAGVQAVLKGTRQAVMVDARPAAFFRGEAKHPAAAWAGSLAGALNIEHESFFAQNAELLADADQVRRIAEAAGYAPGGPELVSFCNTGHWAATNWFALSEVAGIEGVKLYPESMVGWSRAVPEG